MPIHRHQLSRGEPLGKALLALNNAHARELSWLVPERLEHLVGQAFLARQIVVASSARSRGHARWLHDDLFEHARGAGHQRVVCEVNMIPPNPESDAFHAALDLSRSAPPAWPCKTVRYLECRMSGA